MNKLTLKQINNVICTFKIELNDMSNIEKQNNEYLIIQLYNHFESINIDATLFDIVDLTNFVELLK
jgi:hypothetical protein